MFLATSDYPFAAFLEVHVEEIRAELERLEAGDFQPWLLKDAYQGRWTICGLFHADADWILADSCRRGRMKCPSTYQLIRRIRGLLLAGFSRLEPGTYVYPHADDSAVETVRCHLPLEVCREARIRSGGEVRSWEYGRCLAFRSRGVHEAANPGRTRRTVLLVDVALDSARRAIESVAGAGEVA